MHETQPIVTDVRGVSLSVRLSVRLSRGSTRQRVQCVWRIYYIYLFIF